MGRRGWENYYQTLRGLEEKAQAALQTGDTRGASRFAQEMLTKNTDRTTWNYGNEIHSANQILGLASLKEGDIEAAKGFLLAAGGTPGSPQLDSFGPTMTLAQALLRQGEREVVLEYLDMVSRFWAVPISDGNILICLLSRVMAFRHRRRLRQWKSAIGAGEVPTLNRVPEAE